MKVQTCEKYGRLERERRFLVRRFPAEARIVRKRRIVDRYIEGTSLRLRELADDGGTPLYKLTQKVAHPGSGAQQGWITTIALTKHEFDLLAQLPARVLRKTRYSLPPFGIDVFEGALDGLLLAEAEFETAAEADALVIPSFVSAEVSADDRLTGGRLVSASSQDLRGWLAEYGLP